MIEDDLKPMEINLKQQKIISNPLRAEIIVLLSDEPMTSKQVAERLDKNPGTVYYHIQQLFKHDILELVHTEISKGVVEKFYKSRAVLFRVKDSRVTNIGDFSAKRESYVMLSQEELDALSDEISVLFYKYTEQSMGSTKERTAYKVSFEAREYREEDIT